MKCSDGVKKEILAKVVGWVKAYETAGLGADEMKAKLLSFVRLLNQQYNPACVRDVLRALNTGIEGPQN